MEHPRRNILQGLSAAIVIAVAGAVAGLSPALAAELTVTSWGGAYEESQVKAFHEPFAKATGVKVIKDVWDGSVAKIRAMVETKTYSWDVIDVEPAHALQGCDEGFFERIDYGVVGARTNFIPGGAMDCAAGTIVWSTVYAYDPTKFPGAKPKTMADFYDIGKFPGKRGIHSWANANIEMALVADGVDPKKVYEVMDTPEGIDRAFAKLDTIKDHIVFWSSGSKPLEFVKSGETVMALAYNGRVGDAILMEGEPFVVIWDGQVLEEEWLVMVKGSKNYDEALDFLIHASAPEQQAGQAKWVNYGPMRQSGLAIIEAGEPWFNTGIDVLPHMPNRDEVMPRSVFANPEWWADNGDEIAERFTAWMAR